MSNVALLMDLHFGARGNSVHFHKFYERFFSEKFFPYLIDNDIKTVLQLGDLYENRKHTNHFTLHESNRYFFSKFDEYDINLITVLGNHDLFYKNSLEISSPELFLKQYKNITVINKPSIINVDDELITCIPWICEENYQEAVDLITSTKTKTCVGHFEIQNFKMFKNGISAQHGLTQDLFSHYEYVWSGHYHHKSTNGNISYLGTPYPTTWQDYDDQKGFHVFNTKTRKLKFIENPFDIFIQEVYNSDNEDNTDYLADDYINQFADKYVKIQVVKKENPFVFDLFLDKLQGVNPIDLTVIEEVINIESEELVDETADTISIVNGYVDSIPENDLNKDKLKLMLNDLYNSAISIDTL